MNTRRPQAGDTAPVRVDAAMRHTMALLELVRQEEALLGRLSDCVAQLHAVHRARQHLLDVTDAELAEANQVSNAADDAAAGAPSNGEVGR